MTRKASLSAFISTSVSALFLPQGNSDGDYAILQWTSTATGHPRFGMIVHHTGSLREWAYDRWSHIGKLERGLDDAGSIIGCWWI